MTHPNIRRHRHPQRECSAMSQEPWATISRYVAESTGEPFSPGAPAGVGGGCINLTRRLRDGRRSFFVKLNEARRLGMFSAEAEGLGALARAGCLRVPEPVCHGTVGNQAFLVLEYLELGRPGPDGPARAGRQLAALHRVTQPQFGWHRDNTIGDTPQPNDPLDDWVAFWRGPRLGFQLELAARNGYRGRLQSQGERLLAGLEGFLDHAPVPSLLHGDLWSGNLGYDQDGAPVIYDPAVYFGDREADLAMTELFGGFPEAFYAAYREAWPLDPGYRTRRTLYNLYHILNHLNLFGGGYLGQAQGMLDRLLAELG
jgi:protein-ribulosamine 3-kinase